MSTQRVLQSWCEQNHYRLLRVENLIGGFAADVYRIRVQTDTGIHLNLVYKRFAPNRATEYRLYHQLIPNLNGYGPKLVGSIQTNQEQGILLADAGKPMKSLFQGEALTVQRALIISVVQWLADLHIEYEQASQQWLAAHVLEPYPLTSAQSWGNDAKEALIWLRERRLAGIEQQHISLIQTMIGRFYPLYPSWMTGRSTITHGDPHMDNLLVDQGRYRLIDWEFTSVTVPQRDLSILLQDVLNDQLHTVAQATFRQRLRAAGWAVDTHAFENTYQACFFDNTLMMLGWEITKFRNGHLTQSQMEEIVPTKLRWLQSSFRRLFSCDPV
jgi:hypothetical protein